MGTTPNNALRAARMSLLMSQDDFAKALREAGTETASKRLVQRWESGAIISPRPMHARALEAVTGLPIEALGFTVGLHFASETPRGNGGGGPAAQPHGSYSGVWLSRYEYVSSGRDDQSFTGEHYVVIIQHGDRLSVRSLPGESDSSLGMDLTVDRNIATGTWTEHTNTKGYYRGATYHGAIQLLVEPTGRRMIGQWVGFGKGMEVNAGPWSLSFVDASTTKAALDKYSNRTPPSKE